MFYCVLRFCRGRLDAGLHFEAHPLQSTHKEAKRSPAAEILNRVREEVATRNAMHARGA